ncbi:ECF sigma factor [Sulfidibacter corallicola]|uniref:RNA polymerase sigma-70 ECF-like HTH domain-containing protein n=1 Tax=Sulfidibacter corallicola TaxID=2818388 RepID=A0A8A4TG34_SULCO|nr:ECF-type sigma factor [Sulfidibacter corallicola]QTD48886.1 hypothetical protein J3U87_25160 [Sulfidibacter corallicola]
MSTKYLETTDLIRQWQCGDGQAFDILIERVYDSLKTIARRNLAKEFRGSGLDTTELLNEACILMMGKQSVEMRNRRHFLNVASQACYRWLVDESRRRKTQKHGGEWVRVSIEEGHEPWNLDVDSVLVLDRLLTDLETQDPLLVRIVKMRTFAGFTIREVAELLEVPVITVNRKYGFALALLREKLEAEPH